MSCVNVSALSVCACVFPRGPPAAAGAAPRSRSAARAGRPREYDMPSRAVWAVQPGDVPRQTRAHNVYVKPLTISQPRSGARSRRSAAAGGAAGAARRARPGPLCGRRLLFTGE